MLRVIDLYSGCGGLSLGFQNADFEILAAFDNWRPAINVYAKNFKDHKIYEVDLSDTNLNFDIFVKYEPDIIIGGPPCQDFSSAGKRNENLGRADLTLAFARIISYLKPKFFVMENVDRVIKSQTLKKTIQIFKKAGYGLTGKVLDASYCGVPQSRKRFFLIGEMNGADNFLEKYLEANLSEKPMTVREHLGNNLGLEFYYRHPRSYKRRAIFSVDEPSPTIRGVNRPIPEGYKSHPGDKAPLSKKIRALTTIERSYLQTFPKTFIFEGTKSELEQMIGNAVPVKLAEYVARCLKAYIKDKKLKKQDCSKEYDRYFFKRKTFGNNEGCNIKEK